MRFLRSVVTSELIIRRLASAMATSKSVTDPRCSKLEANEAEVQMIKDKWERDQKELKNKMVLKDVDDWSIYKITLEVAQEYPQKIPLQYVGGVDLSFIKGDDVNACAALVVLELATLQVIYKDASMVKLTAPYIPGFLAFREAAFLVEKINNLKKHQPDIMPQVILVDGNGILHPRGFGLACHLGVLTDLPTVGVAKNLLCVDGIERNEAFKQQIETLHDAGEWFPLIGLSGKQHGVVYRSCKETTNPIYISPGHKVSMETAIWIVEKCIKYRVPEPVRQADILSREYIRDLTESNRTKKQNKPKVRAKTAHSCSSPADDNDDGDDQSYLDDGIDLWGS